MSAAKKVLRYLQVAIDFGIMYKRSEKSKLFSYCDGDFSGDEDIKTLFDIHSHLVLSYFHGHHKRQ